MARRKSKAFTLIELTIAIAIIAILISIGVVGLESVLRNSYINATKATLANCKAMTASAVASKSDLATVLTLDLSTSQLHSVQSGAGDRDGPAVQQSATMMTLIMKISANADIVNNLPESSKYKVAGGTTIVLCDAWGNPIIWVPATGLQVTLTGGGTKVITSPDGKGFWASAGPDADFGSGDDNMYSFEY